MLVKKICWLGTSILVFVLFVGQACATPLDDYIATPDPSYTYEHVRTINRIGYTGYVIEMTSQSWRSDEEVDRTTWKHWLTIVVPTFVWRQTAPLVVVGADNGDPYDTDVVDALAPVAVADGAVTVALEMVPNQPLTFADETAPRSSDAIIAYSWDKFFRTGDPTWIAQFPMTKSVVRAMDTVQDFCDKLASPIAVDDFIVAGASKHGWTAWLAAAVDSSRVAAVIPVVIDLLNLEQSFKHHFAAYGFWAPAVGDYEQKQIFDWIDTPEMSALQQIIDPLVYRDRLTMPRFIVNAAGDEFFLPDSSNFYFSTLLPALSTTAGGKYLRYVPNSGHSLDGLEGIKTISMYFHAVLANRTLPELSWSVNEDGAISVQAGTMKPAEVRLWQATNPEKRDFRYSAIGEAWSSTVLGDQGGGVYVGSVPNPQQGWTAYFVELKFSSGSLFDYAFTTDIQVTPAFLPFAADIDYDGEIEGDVNDDGRVSLADAILALHILAGGSVQGATVTADLDGDRRIGLADCVYILNWIVQQ